MATEAATMAGSRSYIATDLDMGEPKWIDVDGIKTRYFDQGEGERIVFFHGGHLGSASGASTARIWELNTAVLKDHRNVIAVDKLGQGWTDNPKRDEDYTMHATVQHAIGFLDRLGKGPYHVVGHSRGGYVVARLSLERPDLVKTCTVVSSGTLSPGAGRGHIVHANPPLPLLSRESQRWVYERYSYHPRVVTEAWLDETVAAAQLEKTAIAVRKMNAEGLLKKQFLPGLARQRSECHRWLLERGMPCPTLITWGLNDPTAASDNGRMLIEMFMRKQRKTEVHAFNQAGHFVYREQAAAFTRTLDGFVTAYA